MESITAAKEFLNNLGGAKLDDPGVMAKIREHAAFLEAHVTGDEQEIMKALLVKLDTLSPLQQAAQQLSVVFQQFNARRAALEAKNAGIREQLQKRRTNIVTIDAKLAELETFKAEVEKKIAACHSNKAKQNECLAKEISVAENLKQTLATTRNQAKQANLEAEDKIVEYQRTIVEIASLGRRI
jgi:chromosome segregation ATPase